MSDTQPNTRGAPGELPWYVRAAIVVVVLVIVFVLAIDVLELLGAW